MMTRLKEERGVAMVLAVLVVFVVLILATTVIAQTIHNQTQSGKNRQRLQSADAAEAGLNYFYNYLQTTKATELVAYTTAAPKTVDVETAPATAQFSATITYYDATGAPYPASQVFTSQTYPSSAFIRSVGTVSGQQPRTTESYVVLTPVYGGFGAAIITNYGLNLGNNLTLNGFTTNDADIYINCQAPAVPPCNLTISNQPDIFGSVYVVNGSATLGGNSNIRQNLWANGAVVVNNPSTVTGNAISSTSSISGSGTINGNATAGTTISGVSVAGTSTPNTLQPPPPSQPVPQIPWVQTDWTDAAKTSPDLPFSVQTFTDCTSAMNYIKTNPTPPVGTGGVVVRIAAVCNLSFANNTSVTLNGNLAIVTDGSITFVNRNTWTGSGSKKKLYLIDAYRSGLNCASGSYNISTSNNTNFVNADVFFYSPCTVNMNNQNTNFGGQVIGGTVNINNQFTLNYVPVKVPGAGEVTGFNEDIAYIREVTS